MASRTSPWWALALLLVIGAGAAVLQAEPTGLARDLEDLASSDPLKRKAAMVKLESGGASVASGLIDELDDEHSDVVKGAIAQVVRKIGPASGDAADLKAYLASKDAIVRHAAAVILQAKPSLATKQLSDLARNADELPSIRCAAVIALGADGTSAASLLTGMVSDQDAPASVRACAMTALCRCTAKGATTVRKIAEDTKAERVDRLAAIRALASDGSKGHAELSSLANAPWAFIREAALSAMPDTKDNSLATDSVKRLIDGTASVRAAAIRTTVALGGEATHKVAIKNLVGDANPVVNILAIQSVARSYKNSASTVQAALRAQLLSGNFRVRYEAAMALFAHGDNYGAGTMLADQATADQGQLALARLAHNTITGK